MAMLNEKLASTQKITQEQRDNLDKLYDEMEEVFKQANEQKDSVPASCKGYAKELQKLEFQLQENWNFPQDANYHTWWNRFKYCTCPKIDNDERFGYEKIISMDCPYHGGILDA